MLSNLRGTNRFELKPAGAIGRAVRRLRYRDCYRRNKLVPELDEQQCLMLDALRSKGTLVLTSYLSPQTLKSLQEDTQTCLEALDFESPCLAQARINSTLHRDLIDNYLLGSPQQFLNRGVAFLREEASSLDQVVREFQPSTLTTFMTARSAAFRKTLLDPRLLAVICHYLGLVPKLVEAYVRRNYPGRYRSMNHFWHRDLNDHQALLKIFIFLTDTTVDNGPHEFVRGSHSDFSKLNGQRYYSDEEVNAAYPLGSPQRLVSEVPAGTVIIEDTRGLHRARMPSSGYRDLGYGVFFPIADGSEPPCYRFPASSYDELDSLQKSFIPASALQLLTS
jgi:hypothetical protein